MESKLEKILNKYLKHIEIELEELPSTVRQEHIAEIRSHLMDEWEALGEKTEENLLLAINNFGDPREIAKEYLDRSPQADGNKSLSYPPTWLVIALTVFIWPAGIILAWISPAWRTRDKLIATFIPLIAPLFVLGIRVLM